MFSVFSQTYVDYLSEALSYEVLGKGITIQTIDPSYVCTAMTEYRLVMPLCNLRSIKTVRVSYCFYA